MNKQEFLAELRARLAGLPQDEIDERISFYGEMIDDLAEDGLTEEQAVSRLGEIEEIVAQIMSDIPLSRLVKERVKPSRALRAWEIVLLVLGSPIWLPLLLALFVVVISIYAVIWSIIILLWAVEASLAACSVGGVIATAALIMQGDIVSGIAMLGAGILCAGLAIFGFFGFKCATYGILKLTKRIFIWIKSCFIKKKGCVK